MKDFPKQNEESVDCGVFLLKASEFISKGKKINFTSKQMPKFRVEITATILEEAFMTEEQDLFQHHVRNEKDDSGSDSDFVRIMN